MAVKLVIDYFYPGIIVINGDNAADNDYVQAQDVKSFCFQYFERN